MVLVIDNYDSFTFNLVQYLGELDCEIEVRRNDQLTVDEAVSMNPERILISPGPCTPKEAGTSPEMIRAFAGKIPIFGVCLGHQCIGSVYGGEVGVNYRLMHGKVSPVTHNGEDVFRGMPNPFSATRYHSLVVKEETLPRCLEVTARSDENEIMGLRHRELPIWGVQFHPESILTQDGKRMMANFLALQA